ncbi:TPA: hypothetical protein ACX3EJ_001068 [Vibrio parahaemolyticus]|uniref:hypothetical protein n=1 Tax=Vibrio parahaemolyticus TaxID=670 RepID=UPI000A3BA06E|nr:hypothetical protein [Vibrio parahaemolyticus]EHV9720281.1 hypothetical protein [Vibrio parahaemolyticus]OUJ46296.1 hypothetical protein BTZ53_10790 [Vibrio parahaemolyticus]HDF8527453.1 hypothetical protein [Vibrio parahaemolyticus]
MSLGIDEKITAEMIKQNMEVQLVEFATASKESLTKIALNRLEKYRGRYTDKQWCHMYPAFDMEACKDYLVLLITK